MINMKNHFTIIVAFFLGITYSQCNDYSYWECNNNQTCEWIENFEMAWCSFDNAGDCNSVSGCSWDCDSWYTWLCGCEGQYQVDYSYCSEIIELSECSEMSQLECNDDEYCNWVSNIEYGNCINLGSSSCEANPNCWGAYQYPGWYSGWYCAGGTYPIDNSYCEEVLFEQGDINGDFTINILDIIDMIDLIINEEWNFIADMNYDRTINVLDIIIVVEMILNN